MLKRILLLFVLCPPLAVAQQVPAPPSSNEQAMAAKIMREIDAGLQCSAALITSANQVTQMQAKIAELEKKLAEKPKDGESR